MRGVEVGLAPARLISEFVLLSCDNTALCEQPRTNKYEDCQGLETSAVVGDCRRSKGSPHSCWSYASSTPLFLLTRLQIFLLSLTRPEVICYTKTVVVTGNS